MSAGILFAILLCPTDLTQELSRLGHVPATGERISLEDTDAGPLLTVERDGRRLQRQLPRGSCAESSRRAAVVVLAWEGELAPVELSLAASRLRRPRLDYDVSAAFVASFAETDFAPGALVEARFGRRGLGVGGYLGFIGEGTRTLPLGGGSFRWLRAALRLGVGYRVEKSRFSFDVMAGPSLALLYLEGSGFTQSLTGYDVDVALGTGIRFGVRAGRVRPFLGAEVTGWLRRQHVDSQDRALAGIDLPQLETLVFAGLSLIP